MAHTPPEPAARPPAMVKVEDAWIRAADVSHMKMDRGYSYTNLRITMRDGTLFVVRDWQGSASDIERRLLDAIEAADRQIPA